MHPAKPTKLKVNKESSTNIQKDMQHIADIVQEALKSEDDGKEKA